MAKAKIQTAPADLAEKVGEFLRLKEVSDTTFKSMNALETEILEQLANSRGNGRYVLPDGRVVTRQDNFAAGNTQFKKTAMKQFAIAIA